MSGMDPFKAALDGECSFAFCETVLFVGVLMGFRPGATAGSSLGGTARCSTNARWELVWANIATSWLQFGRFGHGGAACPCGSSLGGPR